MPSFFLQPCSFLELLITLISSTVFSFLPANWTNWTNLTNWANWAYRTYRAYKVFKGMGRDFLLILSEKVRKGGNRGGYWSKKIIFAG